MARRRKASSAALEYTERSIRPRKMAVVMRQLDAIHERHGELTAELVLSEATAEDHPLHPHFEWDDQRAGHRFRLAQAGAMIHMAQIVLRKKKQAAANGDALRLRKYVSRGAGQGYTPRPAALADAEVKRQLVRSRLQMVQAALRELADVAELDDVRATIAAAVGRAATRLEVEL